MNKELNKKVRLVSQRMNNSLNVILQMKKIMRLKIKIMNKEALNKKVNHKQTL